jgi:hypothetical protein
VVLTRPADTTLGPGAGPNLAQQALIKKLETMSPRTGEGSTFVAFNKKQETVRCAQHDRYPFSSACWARICLESAVQVIFEKSKSRRLVPAEGSFAVMTSPSG